VLIGDPARGMFERETALAALGAATRVAWRDVERIGDDLRVIARVQREED